MRFRILDAARPDELAAWIALWERWPAREVMGHPEYVRAFARDGDRAVAAVGEGDGAGVLFPLVLRPLAAEPWAGPGEARWDATTPYGYGGPFALGDGRGDEAAFWRDYEAWCRGARVVCTFARLSLFPEQLAREIPGQVEVRGLNVVVSLSGGRDAVWQEYDRDVRRRVRVARREGVTIEIDREGARLPEFYEIYEHTMRRRFADAWYRFPPAFFEGLLGRLRGHVALVHAVAAGRILSSELALVSARHVYSFLGGTRSDGFRLFPNEMVRHATADWAAAEGKAGYVLGGGRAPDDGIFRHKRIFAPRGVVPFRTACLVHDEAAYQELVARRGAAAGAGWTPRPEFFPVYRA